MKLIEAAAGSSSRSTRSRRFVVAAAARSAFQPDEKTESDDRPTGLALTQSNSSRSVEMFSKYSIKDLSGYHKGLYCIKWNKDGEYLAAVSGDRSVRICQFNPTSSNAEIVHTIPTPATMHQVCWHPQENMRLALCNDDKPVELWDIRGLSLDVDFLVLLYSSLPLQHQRRR
jgi:WD40 repeat protein